jgi:pteridine reductase
METPLPPVPNGPRGTVLVTGAAQRVGRAIALEFARQGFGLVLTYRSRPTECAETVRLAIDAARAAGHAVTAEAVALDLADTAAASRFGELLAERCRGHGAALDAIVHNASAYEPTALRGIAADAVESMHRVEVVSPLLITERLTDALAASRLPGGGAVVFFSDVYALDRARAGFTPYMLAKAGVETLARQLAIELAPRVRVHCVAPGVILWPDGFPEETKQAILARTPLGRAGTAEEAARLVRFLVLEASFMTGGTIAIDGGRALR